MPPNPLQNHSSESDSEEQRLPLAIAMEWVSRITTISLEMVLPGIFGQWLDARWGTSYLVLVGFALGLTTGLWHLIALTKTRPQAAGSRPDPAVKASSPPQRPGAAEEEAGSNGLPQ